MPERGSGLMLLWELLLFSFVEGLAERYTVSDDSASFLMTRGRQGRAAESFPQFVRRLGRPYQRGSAEYEHRQALFEARVTEIELHNVQPGRLWEAAVNRLADRTPDELLQLRGYRRGAQPPGRAREGAGLLGSSAWEFDLSRLPRAFTWKGKLGATSEVADQSQCGSCWAFAAATVLRAHSELFQRDHRFAVQQILSCTPNPQECGGKGGCSGATAELAMDYVARVGCLSEQDFPYRAKEVQCPEALRLQNPMDVSTIAGSSLHQMVASEGSGARLGMTGFQKLPENQLEPVLLALINEGPIAVSISAGRGWNMYGRGIYDGCSRDAVIDHAVMLVGWGEEPRAKYWQLQNSWGTDWGEGGYIRMFRQEHSLEHAFCGWDKDPSIGSGCKGGPKSVYVCGSCGILYDAVIPTFNLASSGWWATHGRNATTHGPIPQGPSTSDTNNRA
mmetsp:Transcript_70119/g.193978  ORF Transcript_70119/g.193978 Transcript_70119/m.193978 type:complete len:448 (+) Transcript_70119:76-1419(+)|eukprot:CAMPEP_0179096878 /NCGR_PEP_ID=MMETSP0796-20121207/44558_1 /TAXON_ID=73915 /ORGANISM="Pyrodinium bahamense, Strain pbaha01" /LENGTH=447 /DNA_ID=CAMNT_0020794605 /DNA_START=76 /DNA_END=1419 /DNA_ORIENTATION=+